MRASTKKCGSWPSAPASVGVFVWSPACPRLPSATARACRRASSAGGVPTKMPPRFHERGGGNDDRDYVDYSAREGCRSRISEFGRQVTVNFKADADFDERGRGPCHDRFLAFGSTGYRLSYVPRPRGASPPAVVEQSGPVIITGIGSHPAAPLAWSTLYLSAIW